MNNIPSQLQAILEQVTPILRALSDQEARQSTDPAAWSKKQILGHLIDSAANNNQRFVQILIEAPASVPAYHQEKWVALQEYQDHDWQTMIDLWSAYNRHIAYFISQIPAPEMERLCLIGDKPPVSLEWLIKDYLRHLKHHLRDMITRPGSAVQALLQQ